MLRTDTDFPDYTIFHLIHRENTGGVEIGIERSAAEINNYLNYRVYSVMSFRNGNYSFSNIRLILDMFRFQRKIIISSLWLSHFISFILSLFSLYWIAFFHSAANFHKLDKVCKNIAIKFADRYFCDCDTTAKFHNLNHYYIIPYVFKLKSKPLSKKPIDFLFVARADAVKRFGKFIDMMRELENDIGILNVHIYSNRDFEFLLTNNQMLKLKRYKTFINAPRREIELAMTSSKFFVSTSEKEGFGLAIAESINGGSVPIVTKVGEPSIYLDEDKAIFLESSGELSVAAKNKIINLFKNPISLSEVNKRAKKSLQHYGNYTDAMVSALESVHESIKLKRR